MQPCMHHTYVMHSFQGCIAMLQVTIKPIAGFYLGRGGGGGGGQYIGA